ncbi:lysoplasmalogenase [Hymenobacter lucidus]|uniref:Lysoplasmalogenase n=1 Tax=Hymenobacter lucidus TaxID=2880930 RepID=A0ABS8AKJ8_9BACT|nr:lysoplasmalogenase [Hymenobacter lucidus]MCB2406730.1 lysoplasmalogenase [Hymenobacter lucidus]
MKKLFLVLFGLAVAGELLAMLTDFGPLHLICKPLIVLALGCYYRRAAPRPAALVLAALALSWLGDVLLLFQDGNALFFIGGLLAFLSAHGSYIGAYRGHQWAGPGLPAGRRALLALPIIGAGVALLTALYDHLGPLRLPVLGYAAVLVLMVLGALFRYGRTTPASFAWVTAGAGLFMVSDSVLALNKFLAPLPAAGFWIMLTYSTAQLCIVKGLLAHQPPGAMPA